MTSAHAKSTYLLNNTLAAYLAVCIGQEVTVELRNESSVTGCVAEVDGFMNVDLIDAVYVTPNGSVRHFDSFQVRGRHIRFVQLPPHGKPEDEVRQRFRDLNQSRLRARKEGVQSTRSSQLLAETRLKRDELRRTASAQKLSDQSPGI